MGRREADAHHLVSGSQHILILNEGRFHEQKHVPGEWKEFQNFHFIFCVKSNDHYVRVKPGG